MKYIKYLAMFFIMIIAFLAESDDYTYYVGSGMGIQHPYISYVYLDDEERIEILNEIINFSEEEKVDIYFYVYTRIDELNGIYDFFGKEEILSELLEEYKMEPGEYKSFSDRSIEIVQHDLSDVFLDENNSLHGVFILGTSAESNNLYDILKQEHEVNIRNEVYYKELSYNSKVVWWLLIAVMAVFTFCDVSNRKKEMAIRNIMGESVGKSVFFCILTELVVSLLAFFIIRGIVFSFVSGSFRLEKSLLSLMTAVLIDSIMYFYWLFVDYKFVLGAGVNDKLVLVVSYVIKFITTILVISILGLEYNTLSNSIREYSLIDETTEALEGYALLNINDNRSFNTTDEIDAERFEKIYEYSHEIYRECFDKYKPLNIMNVGMGIGRNSVEFKFVNCNSYMFLEDFPELDGMDEDIAILYPESFWEIFNDEEIEKIFSYIDETFTHIDEEYKSKYSVGVESYKGRRTLKSTPVSIFDTFYDEEIDVNPVIIFVKSFSLSKQMPADIYDTLYKISEEEARQLEEEYGLTENDFFIEYNDYTKYSEYTKGKLENSIRLIIPAIVFILVIQLMLVKLVNTISYRLSAKKVALKEIMGVGLLGRHKGQIFWLAIQQAAVVITMYVIVSARDDNNTILGYIVIGVILMLFDCVTNIAGIIKTEKKNNVKVLKGGAL